MSYIKKTLMPGEHILYNSHPHWIVFFPPVIWLLFAIFLPIVNVGDAAGFTVFGHTLCEWVVRFALLMVVYSFFSSYINYSTSEYAITNKRIIMKTGWIRRNAFEIFLQRIESVQVIQGIFGRLLNYGVITIGGVGGSKDMFYFIPGPLTFRQKVQEQLGQVSGKA